MQEHLISFLKNSKVSNQTIESRSTQPVLGISYPKRLIFDKLENYAFDFLKKGIYQELFIQMRIELL